jgi:hypothetical protein
MITKAYLKKQIEEFQIEIKEASREMGLIQCTTMLKDRSIMVWIDDEYDDFDKTNPELNLLLVLYSLETYNESTDIIEWSREMSIRSLSPKVLAYYKSLEDTIKYLDSIGFNMEPPISNYDFHFGAGETESLRRKII